MVFINSVLMVFLFLSMKHNHKFQQRKTLCNTRGTRWHEIAPWTHHCNCRHKEHRDLERIEPENDQVELHVKLVVFVFDCTKMSPYLDTRYPPHHKVSGDGRLWLHLGEKMKPSDVTTETFPISDWRKRNWRFKLEMSMVSMSMTSMDLNPDRARFFRSSHPRPPVLKLVAYVWVCSTSTSEPAPITRIFRSACESSE